MSSYEMSVTELNLEDSEPVCNVPNDKDCFKCDQVEDHECLPRSILAKSEHFFDLLLKQLESCELNDLQKCREFFSNRSHSNATKIDYMGVLVEKYGIKPPKVHTFKDDLRASAARRCSNHYYTSPTDRDVMTALKLCNESLCMAKNSRSLFKSYYNRSAICLDIEAYAECLVNIEMAREADPWSAGFFGMQLEKRSKHCWNKMVNREPDRHASWQQSVQREMKLSFSANPRNPRMVDFIEVRENASLGRHLICNRDVGVGEALIIDEPFSAVLFKAYAFTHCHHCHVECPYTAIPCENCIPVMFCSEKCRLEANNQYHRYECRIYTEIRETFSEVGQLAIRTFLKAFTLFDEKLPEMQTYFESNERRSIDDIDWSDIDPKDCFQAICNLSTNREKRHESQLMSLCYEAHLISDALLYGTAIGKLCKLRPEQSFIKEIILHLMLIGCAHRASLLRFIGYKSSLGVAAQAEAYGFATLPILGIINHSCIPNLFPIHGPGDRVGLFTYRPIKKGDQLTISYGVCHTDHDLRSRQDFLRRYYDFVCQCEACVRDYPTRFVLAQPDYPLDETQLTQGERRKIKQYDPELSAAKLEYAKRVVTECCRAELHLKFNCSRQFGLLTQCLQGTYGPAPVMKNL